MVGILILTNLVQTIRELTRNQGGNLSRLESEGGFDHRESFKRATQLIRPTRNSENRRVLLASGKDWELIGQDEFRIDEKKGKLLTRKIK